MKNVQILFLNNKAMRAAGAEDIREGIKSVKQIYSFYNYINAQGQKEPKLTIPDKVVLRFGPDRQSEYTNGRINCMPGRIHGGDVDIAGVKWIGSGIHNAEKGLPRANALVILNDPDTKLPVCIADGTAVSTTRTGAAGGVAVELLSRPDSTVYTICGAGAQGRTQLHATLIARPGIKTVYVYDKFPASAEKYVDEMRAKYPDVSFTAITEDQLPDCVGKSDIVTTITTASSPFMKAEWIKKGTLLINMSGNEVERQCVLMADKTVVDFWESVKHRNSSTIAQMSNDPNDKYLDFQPTAELGEILNGEKTGRDNDEQIIYFNSVGAGVLDLMIAYRCYETAKAEGLGQVLDFWEGDE